MKSGKITIEQVLQFAKDNAGKSFSTLARNRPFVIGLRRVPRGKGIRFDLPSGAFYPVSAKLIGEYLKIYNSSPPQLREKTTIFKRLGQWKIAKGSGFNV